MVEFSYLTRPAKSVVRRMLAEAFRQLTPIGDLKEYRYVGLGGLEFVDFELFHRELGIVEMVSIENDANYNRFVANRPFANIDVRSGQASDRLLDLNWDGFNIVWLDYECQLTDLVINDVSFLCRQLVPGSVLLVTLNAVVPHDGERIKTLFNNVGDRVPVDIVKEEQLAKWGFAHAQRRILDSQVKKAFKARTGLWFHQLFDFNYKDSIFMQTWGGLVMTKAQDKPLKQSAFGALPYVVERGKPPFEITLPVLTERERLALNQQLPRKTRRKKLAAGGLSKDHLEAFERVYRWYRAS